MTFHLNQALGVGTQTKTKGGEGWGNSQVQLHAQQLCAHSSCVHTAWCVYLQHLTDSIIMGSAIISSHQSNIKAITCVSAFSVVIKANSTVIYLRCVNIPAFSPSLVPHMLLASHLWKNCTTVLQQGGCMCVWGGGGTELLQWGSQDIWNSFQSALHAYESLFSCHIASGARDWKRHQRREEMSVGKEVRE